MDQSPSLATYAARWLRATRARYRPTTVRGYASVLRRHLMPAFGSLALSALTRGMIRELLVTLLGQGLSAGSVHMVHATLSAILSAAEDDDLLAHNPARGAARKLWRRGIDGERKAPTREEFQALLVASRTRYPILHALWLVLAHTGLRPGEGVALAAHDVDLAARRLTCVRTYHGSGQFGPLKSGKHRVIPLNRTAATVLAERIAVAQPPERWLFSPRGDLPYSTNFVQRAFRRLRAEARIRRRLTPHSLRHATATWLIERGAREVHVQRLLGHHSIQLTIDLYARGADLPPIVDLLEEHHRGPPRSGGPVLRRRRGGAR